MEEKLLKYPSIPVAKVIDTIPVPHPYCITPKHLRADSMYLNADTIRLAEKDGAHCGTRGCKLSYDEHKSALLIEINSDEKELKDVPGLQDYLLSINDMAIADGYAGYAFIKKCDHHDCKCNE